MSELVINGLVRKRGELAGEIEHTQARLRTLLADVGSMDAAIRVFNPDYKVEGIKAKRFREGNGKRHDTARLALDILREAATPLTSRQIAERMTPEADGNEMKHTVKSIEVPLLKANEKGVDKSKII